MKRAAVIVRHRWKFHKSHNLKSHNLGPLTLQNVHICRDCNLWTANLPLYLYEVCEARDRRKNKVDRRSKEQP